MHNCAGQIDKEANEIAEGRANEGERKREGEGRREEK
jgi:hypothetical protein